MAMLIEVLWFKYPNEPGIIVENEIITRFDPLPRGQWPDEADIDLWEVEYLASRSAEQPRDDRTEILRGESEEREVETFDGQETIDALVLYQYGDTAPLDAIKARLDSIP